MASHKLFAPRRVGVSGSSHGLPQVAVLLCQAVGSELAKNDNVLIVSGGTKRQLKAGSDDLAADWHIVNTAQKEILNQWGTDAIYQRIETVVTGEVGSSKSETFHIGRATRTRGKTNEARRFSFVRSLDGLLSVAGGYGTAQEIALAMELDIPLLPVPSFGGSAQEFWCSYEVDLMRILQIDRATADRWRLPAPDDPTLLQQLASEMVTVLLAALPRRCFVIMPFTDEHITLYDLVIEPTLLSVGHSAIRLDRTAIPGDAGNQIHEGIRRCDYVIAVLDGLKPNVLYELGLAHAYGKRTILMNHAEGFGGSAIPFDLVLQQRVEYRTLDANLLDRLKKAITSLPGN
jgi:predicted Rossmann-fold nucleotide-binding protein